MSQQQQRVKVLFRLEKDEDGHPPVEVESLWGIVRPDGIELDNIPFYARGVALGDVVSVHKAIDGALEFEAIVRRSRHSTFRILLQTGHPADVLEAMNDLVSHELSVEQDVGPLLAVDVPPDKDMDAVLRLLRSGIENRRWEVEEGYYHRE